MSFTVGIRQDCTLSLIYLHRLYSMEPILRRLNSYLAVIRAGYSTAERILREASIPLERRGYTSLLQESKLELRRRLVDEKSIPALRIDILWPMADSPQDLVLCPFQELTQRV
jgi:hypothetical protein